MKHGFLFGKVILAPVLVLLVLMAVAGGQIVASLDLRSDVRKIDNIQIDMRANIEAIVLIHEAEVALRLFQANERQNGQNGPPPDIRARLGHEAERILSLAEGFNAPAGGLTDKAQTDRELLRNYAKLLEQLSHSQSSSVYYEEIEHLHGLLAARLKKNDQALHMALAETSASARLEAEAAMPAAILLTIIGAMTALAASLAITQSLLNSFGRLAGAMRGLVRGDEKAASADVRLGQEFSEVSEALDLFRRAILERQTALAALAQSEEGLQNVLDAAPVPLALTRLTEGKVIYANQHCRNLFKVDGTGEGLDVRQFYANPDDRGRFVEQLRRHGKIIGAEVLMKRADGEDRLMLVSAVTLSYRGETALVLGYSDITEHQRILAKLQESEERLRLIVETAPVPLVLTKIADDTVLYVNRLAQELFRVPKDSDVLGHPASDYWVDPASREKMKEMLKAEGGRLHNVEARLKRSDGSWFWASMSADSTEFKGDAVLLVSVDDITGRKEMEDELRRHATTDTLTGIANRRHFIDVAEREFARAKRYGHALSIVLLDIDDFKRVNDEHGHLAGDKVVQAVARICKSALREIDHLGRTGDEEFAMLLPETDGDKAFQAAERIRASIEAALLDLEGLVAHISVTASAGVAAMGGEDKGFDQTLARANQALGRSKLAGRNRVSI
ncbi:putative Diguanylate cyclase [Rhodospirillaceae bacterium LM-1]|nr:putative Diguanylate cyclase [Rhodospirillaceae bacterium LM-1]